MPHIGSGAGGDDLASSDEIKVFKEEGDEEKEKAAAENLNDLKSSLITEGEKRRGGREVMPSASGSDGHASIIGAFGKAYDPLSHASPFGYVVPTYHHHPNGTLGAVSMANKVGMVGGPHSGSSPLSFMMHNIDAFPRPPPAHMGIHIDPKTGIPRAPMYPLPGPSQYPHAVFPDFAQQLQWHTPAMYPIATSAFRGPYPPSLPNASTGGFTRFSPTLIPHHPSLVGHPGLTPHPALLGGPKHHQDFVSAMAGVSSPGILGGHSLNHNHEFNSLPSTTSTSTSNSITNCNSLRHHVTYSPHGSMSNLDQKPSLSRLASNGSSSGSSLIGSPPNKSSAIGSPGSPDSNRNNKSQSNSGGRSHSNNSSNSSNNNKFNNSHIKKPLNAFMLYMKEMRSQVVAECTLKESAAINQILGKRWHSLTREEQAKYYDMARKERQMHMQLYPGWTARDNYANNLKKKKKKRDKSSDGEGGALKKCRARFGLDQQSHWCKPCRRKKKCIRYLEASENNTESEADNIRSVSSVDVATPDSKTTNDSDDNDHTDNITLSANELSLSSPPTVPTHDYLTLPHHNHHHHFLSNHHPHHNTELFHHHQINHGHIHNDMASRSQSSTSSPLATLSCPPRNSPIGPNNPLSIEQLTRPHCPQLRTSYATSSITSSFSMSMNSPTSHSIMSKLTPPSSTATKSSSSSSSSTSSLSDPMSIPLPQLPTPPSADSSSASAPQMLTVA